MEEYVECEDCGWMGYVDELVCSEDDMDKPVSETEFNRCPDCDSTSIVDLEDEE